MSKSTKISFIKSRFFVEGILKKPPVRVKGRRVSSSRKSKGIPVEGIPKKIPKQVKGRKITSSKQSKGLLRRASRKKKRKTQKGGKRSRSGDKNLLIKFQKKNMKVLNDCEKSAKNKSQKKKCMKKFHTTWEEYSKFLKKNNKKQYTPKQQREAMKLFFGKK